MITNVRAYDNVTVAVLNFGKLKKIILALFGDTTDTTFEFFSEE